MQGVFESRLMNYDRDLAEEYSEELFQSFIYGYNQVRRFSAPELAMIPHLYAVIMIDLAYDDNSLSNLIKSENKEAVSAKLRKVETHINGNYGLCAYRV